VLLGIFRFLLESGASLIEFGTDFGEAFRREGKSDLDVGGLLLCWRFIAVGVWVQLGSEPAQDVEFHPNDMCGLWVRGLGHLQALVGQEVRLILSCVFPAFSEPGSASAPIIELLKVR